MVTQQVRSRAPLLLPAAHLCGLITSRPEGRYLYPSLLSPSSVGGTFCHPQATLHSVGLERACSTCTGEAQAEAPNVCSLGGGEENLALGGNPLLLQEHLEGCS